MADALAKKAKTCKGTQVRLEELPEDIASLVGFDVHWSLFSFIMNKLPGTTSLVSQKKKKKKKMYTMTKPLFKIKRQLFFYIKK